MVQQIIILFLIVLSFAGFSLSIQQNSSNYDITIPLQNAIQGILEKIDTTEKVILLHGEEPFHSTYSVKVENRTFIGNIKDAKTRLSSKPNIYANFITNEMRITIQKYQYSSVIPGELLNIYDMDQTYTISYCNTTLKNITIEISRSFENNSNEKFRIDFPSNLIFNYVSLYEKASNRSFTKFDDKDSLKQFLESKLLQQMQDNLEIYGKNISDSMQHNTRTIFTSIDPDFFNDPYRYSISIPTTPYMSFSLRNITIRGLTNFVSLNRTDEKDGNFGIALLINNIRGELILDYGSEREKPMELIFTADDVFIRANLSNHRSKVEIRNYRVVRTGINNVSLTDQQSAMIIQHIESAVAMSLIPSMTDLKTMKQVLNEWVPFNEDQTAVAATTPNPTSSRKDNKWILFNEDQTAVVATTPNPTTSISDNQTDTYQYHISFKNITIKLISGIPNSKEIRCEFPNDLKVVHKLNTMPIQTVHWNSNKSEGIDICFHANFTSINFSQIESNSSIPNNTYELHLDNNEDIKVEVTPIKDIDEDKALKLKEKINTTLISMANKRFVRKFKSVVSLPFEICSQAAKMVDNFFLNFIDELSKKCSLR